MRIEQRNTVLGVACLLCGCLMKIAAQAPPSPPGDIDRGRTIYVKDGCYECHGREGQGSPSSGPRVGPTAMSFEAFSAYVRRPRGEMPPYTPRVLGDAQLADVYAFVGSRPRPAAPLP